MIDLFTPKVEEERQKRLEDPVTTDLLGALLSVSYLFQQLLITTLIRLKVNVVSLGKQVMTSNMFLLKTIKCHLNIPLRRYSRNCQNVEINMLYQFVFVFYGIHMVAITITDIHL